MPRVASRNPAAVFRAVALAVGCSLFAPPRCRALRPSIASIASIAGLHPQMASANIYPEAADAKAEIRAALAKAAREHKRVILDFGGNWCVDCQLLNLYFHDPSNAGLLASNYVVVDINIGEYDRNLDIARKYGIPINRGVPALVVLDSDGKVIYAQRNAEFEKMSKLDSAAVTAFLMKWKPGARAAHPRAAQSARHAKASSGSSGN